MATSERDDGGTPYVCTTVQPAHNCAQQIKEQKIKSRERDAERVREHRVESLYA